ncbi:LacI family DNA-binding transcriptional regulator [Pelosinus sp. sgz500959]|uniref:LacI family DNA-binding transcriptional regulator n=1 Tax=Pelosinus sp. sgz500959 TaxID=3242472 RepID=UPI00366B6C4F
MPVTIKDIALIAGVSFSTVSRSLNDSNLVAEATKKQIKEIAKELGFEFNASARSLSTQKTGSIGVIYPESFEAFHVNLFYNSLHNHIRKTLEREALDLIVAFAKNRFDGDSSNIERLVKSKKVDGLIIVSPILDQVDKEALLLMKKQGIPFVFLHHYPNDPWFLEEANIFCTDHFTGGYRATEHLIQHGHKRIACITAVGNMDEFSNRTDGYRAALTEYNIHFDEKIFFHGDRSFQSGYEIIMDNKEKIKDFSAIFSQNDLMALGAIQALTELKLEVPEDIAVVGYDDIELLSFFRPLLTTIHQPREKIAVLACETLINLIKDQKTIKRNILVKPSLIIRESCGSL